MNYETNDIWFAFRSSVRWAVFVATVCSLIVAVAIPRSITIVAAALLVVATVFGIMGWRAPTKRESAWHTTISAGIAIIGILYFRYGW